MKIAIVTGASSGIGREFARQIAAWGTLDEIWAVARRENRLQELARTLKIPVKIIPVDLTQKKGIEMLESLLKQEQPQIKILVNAAGFGKIGDYKNISRLESGKMIRLNCQAPVDVTMLALPYMRKDSHILQICSTAGFQPLPEMSVYAATKAFLLRYSRALRWELINRGIVVTAVCPYWVRQTEFIQKASTGSHSVRHFPLAGTPEKIVRQALRDSLSGAAVSTPGLVGTAQRILTKLLPEELVIAGWELLRRL